MNVPPLLVHPAMSYHPAYNELKALPWLQALHVVCPPAPDTNLRKVIE